MARHYIDVKTFLLKIRYITEKDISLLDNRTILYAEDKAVNRDAFENDVIGRDEDRSKFNSFRKNYLAELEMEFPDIIDVASSVVSSSKRKFKNEIKLDTNISIKLDGNLDYAQKTYRERI